MPRELPTLTVPDARAWRDWLGEYGTSSDGVWLVLAKKGSTEPTRITYAEALEEALCHGWIDGQARGGDAHTYRQRFTPRRRRSSWSRRNVTLAERLIAEGRMREPGLAQVEAARADGRWEAAYAGAATIEVPPDLARALEQNAAARETFDGLSSQNRYAILYRLHTAVRPETRARRLEQFVAMLARGETIHPQGQPRARGPRRDSG
jgi:uncharacterized protein YdeI (YjbR/CyaY-like superfamily)